MQVQNPLPSYLRPYARAAEQYGGGFRSLLWASEKTQQQRFDAICRILDLNGKSILDAGCGRADLLGFLKRNQIEFSDYTGLEAVDVLAEAAAVHQFPNARIIIGDFVSDPLKLFVGADVIVFSGSLNTLPADAFYAALSHAYDAAGEAVIFNFLSSPALAGQDYLVWHDPQRVLSFVNRLCCDVRTLADYLHGDCTVAMVKPSVEH